MVVSENKSKLCLQLTEMGKTLRDKVKEECKDRPPLDNILVYEEKGYRMS